MAALWVILFIIGVPIVVVFWVVVALIIALIHDNKKSSMHPHIDSSMKSNKSSKGRKRSAKQTIMKLK
jgi:hypothetical protein